MVKVLVKRLDPKVKLPKYKTTGPQAPNCKNAAAYRKLQECKDCRDYTIANLT